MLITYENALSCFFQAILDRQLLSPDTMDADAKVITTLENQVS